MNVKKLISFVLIATMLACSFVTTGFASTTAPIETATAFARGTGTSSDPYVIETAGQFKYFRDQVNAGMCGTLNTDNSISNAKSVYVELSADIDLEGESWTPIGAGHNTFRGSFDGKGHKITNFVLDTPASGVRIGTNTGHTSEYFNTYDLDDSDFYGLFATVDDRSPTNETEPGIVKNLGIENATIKTTANGKKIKAAYIVARPSCKAIIQDCYVKNVTATLDNGDKNVWFGGIMANGPLKEVNGCYVTGMTATINTSAESGLAPFAAYMSQSATHGEVKNCYSADITFNVASGITTGTRKITNISFCGPDATNVYSSVDLSSYSGSDWATGDFYGNIDWAKNHKVAAPMSEADLKAMKGVTFDQSTNFEGVAVDRFVTDKTGANGFPRLWWENNNYIAAEYTITAIAPSNGTLTATVDDTAVDHVTEDTAVTVTATPAEGYQVVSISANGEKIWEGETPSVDPVVAQHTPTVNTVYTAVVEEAPDPNAYPGAGTVASPYVISTAGQLKKFRNDVNAGMCGTLNSSNNSISSPKYVYVELGADIDLEGESWTPIGIGANIFRGSFDGKGHKITNLNLSTAVSGVRIGTNPSFGSQYNYYDNNTDDIYGLFATVDDLYHKDTKPRGIVKNLGVENVTVTTTANSKSILAGVIVARPSAHAIVQDCYVKNVTATLNNGSKGVKFGGIAAQGTMNEINGCYVTGMNTTFNTSAESAVAPFIAYMGASTDYGYVKNCYSADITFNVATDIAKNNKKITNISYCGPDATNVYSSVDLSSYSGWATGDYYNITTNPWAKNHKVAPMSEAELKAMKGVTFDQSTNFAGDATPRFAVNYSGGFPKLWWEENIRPTYSVSVASSIANGMVTLSADTVYVGESVNVTAAPSAGYMLTAIKANGENIWPAVAGETSTASQTITHTPTEATEYSATFEPVPAEDPNAYSGAGTEADPYLIGTAGQLKKFRDDVNAGMCGSVTEAAADVAVSNPKYVYVKLTDDIDLGGASWTPIGNATATFRGSFDGNGHKITNFVLDTPATNVRIGTNPSYSSEERGEAYCTVDSHNLYGLFATVDDRYDTRTSSIRGIVKNLGVENVTITTATGDTPNKAGAIIARTSAHASVENCYAKNVTATLNGNDHVYFGGLLGYAEQFYKMAGCYVDTLNVTVNTTGGTPRVAALSSRTNGGASAIVTDCYSANVTYTKASTCKTTPNITNTTFGVHVAGGATYKNVYSTMDLTTYTKGWNTGAYQSGDKTASWGSTNKVAATAVDDLKNLTNGVTFTNGVYNKSNSGGFPKLSWEANPYGYTFSATQSTGGTITLDKTTATVAAEGDPVDVTITATPAANYSVKAIKANGSVIWSAGSESAVTHIYTATASTEFTAVFEIPLDPGLGKYIDPAYTAGFSSVNTGSPAGTTTNYGQYSWSAPTANSAGSPFAKPVNEDGFFTLAPATPGTKVHGFAVQNIQYNQYQSLKSTVDTYIRLNQIDGTDLSTLANGATMAEFVFGGNVVSVDFWKGVSLRLVKDTDSSTGYSWGLYYTSNYSTETGYTEVGNTRIEAPADIFGVWYHVVYDIDTTIGQARATITPEGGTAAVIEACSTGLVYTMEQANARITVSKDNADGTANLSAFNHGKSSVGFNGFVTIDLKQHYIIQEHFFHIDDIATTIDGGNISATADMYGIKSIYSGNETATTPPIYIAVYDNSKQMVGVAKGQIVKESISGGMRYTPTATLDAAALKLADGTYTVKVMLWSDKQVPYRAVAEKTLTVNGGTYTLN